VVTLLQLLLANFTASSMPSFLDLDEGARSDTPEDVEAALVDATREKEILGKAITGILILMLKWFRVSRIPLWISHLISDVLKFEYLSQLLYDSNYHILAAKLLGMDTPVLTIPISNEISSQGYPLTCIYADQDYSPSPSETVRSHHPLHVVVL
jgi:Domain of unknown function (DUF3402)